jgi:hypothetical protein
VIAVISLVPGPTRPFILASNRGAFMNPYVETIVAIGCCVISVAFVVVAVDVRRIRYFISSWKMNVMSDHVPGSRSMNLRMTLLSSPAGYAIFVFRGGNWVLESDLSNRGFEPVLPTIPGAYEGQVVKKESALAIVKP